MINSDNSRAMEIATTRSAQEVQAAMIVAKRFPRDDNEAIERIRTSCKRVKLAEVATYSYPKGGTNVTGPSIRLAECLAQRWGNIDFGIKELEQRKGESLCEAYAWDLETNTRRAITFTVKHRLHTRGGVKELTDPRDIYEMMANQGSRRLRACILAVIPGDVCDEAVAQCAKTLAGQSSEPLEDRVRKMLAAFKDRFGVSKEMIEARLGHNAAAITEEKLVNLRGIYQSLIDEMSKPSEWFAPPESAQPEGDTEEPASRTAAAASKATKSRKKSPAKKGTKKEKPAPAASEETTEAVAENPDMALHKQSINECQTVDEVEAMAQAIESSLEDIDEAEEIRQWANLRIANLQSEKTGQGELGLGE